MSNLLNFFSLSKGRAVEGQFAANPPQATPQRMRCFCGEPSCVASIQADVFESVQHHELGFCQACFESFRCWLTSRKVVFHQQY